MKLLKQNAIRKNLSIARLKINKTWVDDIFGSQSQLQILCFNYKRKSNFTKLIRQEDVANIVLNFISV